MSENTEFQQNYALIDKDGNILEELISYSQCIELTSNSKNSGIAYYYYPNDETILAELIEKDAADGATELRFLKPIETIA